MKSKYIKSAAAYERSKDWGGANIHIYIYMYTPIIYYIVNKIQDKSFKN